MKPQTLILLAMLGACGDDAAPVADSGVARDSGIGARDGGPDTRRDGSIDSGANDTGTTAPDAGLECSNATRFGITPEQTCPAAVGEVAGGPENCSPATPGWTPDHLTIGPSTFCIYNATGPDPDFCTLPLSPTGAPPWQWLEPDCIVVGP